MQIMRLEDMFPGDDQQKEILSKGFLQGVGRQLHVKLGEMPDGTPGKRILAIAAVTRDPGRSSDRLTEIQDFQNQSVGNRKTTVDFYWNIYGNEGIVNNGVNKIAALLSSGGEFRIRSIKKGKTKNAEEVFLTVLRYWMKAVNAGGEDAVVTGSRGLRAIQHQGVRQALVEGSWVGRTVWADVVVPGLPGSYSLPMNIQTISTANLEPVKELIGTGVELFWWIPSSDLLTQLLNPASKEIKQLLKKYIPSKTAKALTKDRRMLLDPSLLMHVKHRGTDREAFGESLIQSTLSGIAYRRTVDELDTVTMANLINRLTVVMVGSSDPTSPYSAPDVAQARMALMNTFFENPGPNMTVVWAGDDVDIKDVGAHNQVLDLDGRHGIGEGKVKIAMGVPDALLSGTSAEGKAAGWASAQAAAAEMQELQDGFAQALTTLGERIALENGFTDLDMIFEADESNMVDKLEERTQSRSDFLAGLFSIRTSLLQRGLDPDGEYEVQCKEKGLTPGEALWVDAFMAPQGQVGQGDNTDGTPKPPAGQGDGKDPGAGRPPKEPTTKAPPAEKKGTQENK